MSRPDTIGLVHGRFQPFHNGHRFLVEQSMKECGITVILISYSSPAAETSGNPFDFADRKSMIESLYPRSIKDGTIRIGANIPLLNPASPDAQWDILLSSCVLSLTGKLPTVVYAGTDYSVEWRSVRPIVKKFQRQGATRGSLIREAIAGGHDAFLAEHLPLTVLDTIKHQDKEKPCQD